VVSGCGCAYACGESIRVNDDGTHEVVHDLQDSATTTSTVERWCFDAAGHGNPQEANAPAGATCLDIFYDRTPCGGECIPSTRYMSCRSEGGSCSPSP